MKNFKAIFTLALGLAISSFSVGLAQGNYHPGYSALAFFVGAVIAYRGLFMMVEL